MWNCKHCNLEFDFEYGRSGAAKKRNHLRWCDSNPKHQEYLEKLNVARKAASKPEVNKQRNIAIKKNWENGKYKDMEFGKSFRGKNHSDKTKKQISQSRIKYLKNNPEKHPWKLHDKFKSKPCEVFKQTLKDKGFTFEEEFTPIANRFFSVDIAFPNFKICIEINGEQHYNRDGSLRKYYKNRHYLIKNEGWNIVEIHYLKVYDDFYMNELIKWLYSVMDSTKSF